MKHTLNKQYSYSNQQGANKTGKTNYNKPKPAINASSLNEYMYNIQPQHF